MTDQPQVEPLPTEPVAEAIAPGFWLWNSQAPPPISGQIRTDTRDWATAKQLNIDRRMDGGSDASTDLGEIKVSDTLRLAHQTDPTRFAVYTVTAAPVRIVDYYQYGVSYTSGGGVIPNSGTRIALTWTMVAPRIDWQITSAREPNRFYILLQCPHGKLTELVATDGVVGRPDPYIVLPNSGSNLRRRFGCQCVELVPPLA